MQNGVTSAKRISNDSLHITENRVNPIEIRIATSAKKIHLSVTSSVRKKWNQATTPFEQKILRQLRGIYIGALLLILFIFTRVWSFC